MSLSLSDLLLLLYAPITGSFLGVLITRLPADEPVVIARSKCPSCARKLGALDLIPIISWLALRGRCRSCRARISAFYPLVEVGALAIAAWSVALAPGWIAWASALFGWVLFALAIIDFRKFLLPDVLVLPLLAAGLAATYFIAPESLRDHVIGAVAAFVALEGVRHFYRWLRGRDGLGAGDPKLFAAIGAWVGWQGLPTVVLYAALAGLAASILWHRRRGDLRADTALPFGTYLALAAWLVWTLGPLRFGDFAM